MDDNKLDAIALEYAKDILAESKRWGRDLFNLIHEWIDSSEWIVYHSEAHEICQNCDLERGHEFMKNIDCQETDYDKIAAALAYGELCYRVEEAIAQLIEEEDS